MDDPFRGSVSIAPVPFQRVLDDVGRFSRRGPS
jgi:hypothetical protein